MIEAEEIVVRPILEQLADTGVRALDAACGTGRHAGFLVELGCHVTGIDQSAEMLDIARSNVPAATFDVGDVEALPYDDDSFGIANISLALCHLPDPTVAIGELGRVLTPGGSLVISDPHPLGGAVIGGQAFYGGIAAGKPMTWVRNHYHLTSTWLDAFDDAGLRVDRCLEVPFTEPQLAATPAMAFYPEAVRSGFAGLTNLWVWIVSKPT